MKISGADGFIDANFQNVSTQNIGPVQDEEIRPQKKGLFNFEFNDRNKKKIESSIITGFSLLHTIAPIAGRIYKNKKTGIPAPVFSKSDIPSAINSAVNVMFTIDDFVFDRKFQEKWSFSKGFRTATTLYTSAPTLTKAADAFFKIRKPGTVIENPFGLNDYFNLLPILSSFIVPIMFDNTVSLKGTVGNTLTTLTGNYINRMVAKSGNKKLINAFNWVQMTSSVSSQVLNNPMTKQMVSSSQNSVVKNGADLLGGVTSQIAYALSGSPAAGGYNMQMYNGGMTTGYNPQRQGFWRGTY